MKSIAILDVETTGTDDTATCVEVAAVLFSVPHASPIRAFSSLIRAPSNPAFSVNRIPEAMLLDAPTAEQVWPAIGRMASEADAFVAHFAEFDSSFVPPSIAGSKPWICSCHDLTWPRQQKPGEGLVKLALAHDLGISVAHRAAADVDILARLFARVAEMGVDLQSMLARGLRPKATYQALVSYDDRALASEAGFRWNEDKTRRWLRRMANEDVETLPFKTQLVS